LTIVGYYVPQTLLRHEGIRRRSRATAEAWRDLGVATREISSPDGAEMGANLTLLGRHLASDSAAARQAAELFRSGELQHVHARLLAPTLPWIKLARDYPVSLEIHTPIFRPESSRDLLARIALGAPTAPALVSKAQGAAFITHELAQRREYRRIEPKVVVGAGKKLSTPEPAPRNDRLKVGMAVGSVARWHGVETLASWADQQEDLEFVVVCPRAIEATLRSQFASSRLTLLPTSDQETYRSALASLDVAVGSLNLEAHGYGESATLKVRDYLDVGTPTLLAYPDTNLIGLHDPAILLAEHSVDRRQLVEWIRSMQGARVQQASRDAVSMQRIERNRLETLGLLGKDVA